MKKIKDPMIVLDLQFFAADDEGKTEEATPKKKEDTRKKGQVAKSMEINTAVLFLFAFSGLSFFGPYMKRSIQDVFVESFTMISTAEKFFEANYMSYYVAYVFLHIMKIVGPLLLLIMLAGLLSSFVQVGWHPTTEPMAPKFSKLNPLSGLKKMFSTNSLMELFKALFKIGVLAYIIYSRIQEEIPVFLTLIDMSIEQIMSYVGALIISIGYRIAAIFTLMAILDYAYQRYKFNEDIKMTKQEIKDEHKQSEGDPQLKSKIKQTMREMSTRRMMQEVPEADVIITNPTHYAVAISYDPSAGMAPRVTAKGADYIAQKIKEKAKESNIEIVENKPLARTLYAVVDIGDEIPEELYQTVAEVLAFVYALKNKE